MEKDPYLETFAAWNKVAQLYQEKFMDLTLYNATYDLLCENLPESQPQLLEVGCGPGNITKYLLNKRPDFKILGTDIAPNMISMAAANNPTAEFTVLDARNLNTLNRSFHAIISGFCIPYLSPADTQQFLQNCADKLNNNGLLYLSFVEGDPAKSGYMHNSTGDAVFFYYHTLGQLKTYIKTSRFSEPLVMYVEYTKADTVEIHSVLLARKP